MRCNSPLIRRLMLVFLFGLMSPCLWSVVLAAEPVTFQVETVSVLQELNPGFCWFHPRTVAIPQFGQDGRPAVVMTIQKHLSADDHYSGLWVMRTDDLGKTWVGPNEIPELGWRRAPGEAAVDLSVADVTPQWHAKTGKVIAIGIQVRYDKQGIALLDQPRSYDFAYTVFDPKTNQWTVWRNVQDIPEPDGKFHTLAPGCVQSVIKADGTLLVPVYMKGPKGSDYKSTVLHLGFDGDRLSYLGQGDEIALEGGRGLYEPSLAHFQGRYFLTLRNDARGYFAASEDGLKFGSIEPWMFNDGKELGSDNTQTHWLSHSEGLYLCYTRRGANNDHIPRHRAPLFVSRVDTAKMRVIRETEQALMPERGAMLGNFGASTITPDEAWVTDAEYITKAEKPPGGADGTTWLARVKWTKPDRQVPVTGPPIKIVTLGDSITRGMRSGVGPTETFSWMLAAELRARGLNVDVANTGIGGEQANQAVARFERDIVPLKPQIVTIMYGTNDSYVDKDQPAPRVTKEQYQASVKQLIRLVRAAGATPVLMTPPRWGQPAKNGAGENPNRLLAEYLPACHEVARDERVPFIDHFQIWTDAEAKGTDIGTWTTDQCHPNAKGHRELADAILPQILNELKR